MLLFFKLKEEEKDTEVYLQSHVAFKNYESNSYLTGLTLIGYTIFLIIKRVLF